MKLINILLIIIGIYQLVECSTSDYIMIGQENGISSLTIRSFGPVNLDKNPLPGKVIVKLEGANSLLIDGLAVTVGAIRGTTYYTLLAYDVDIFLYAIDLTTGNLLIDRYSPNQEAIYVYGLVYEAKTDTLMGLSSLSYSSPSQYDVVTIDPSSGAIIHHYESGEFPDSPPSTIQDLEGSSGGVSTYSGVYAYDYVHSQLFVVFRVYTNLTESTQEGMVIVNTLTGAIIDTVWFTGYGQDDNYLYSLVYDAQSDSLYAATGTYVGTDLSFVSIDKSSGFVTLIQNTTTVTGGNGPVIVPDSGVFICPGSMDTSSNTLYYVNLKTGKVQQEYHSFSVMIEFLSLYPANATSPHFSKEE